MNYAIIETGGKQYRVAAGDELAVERLNGSEGDDITFDRVLMLGGATCTLGKPLVANARVSAKIIKQDRGDKILVFKKLRRKNHRRLRGHRQSLTRVRIGEIHA
ncbi:MAG: 50S ribosomal protein L21 [Alphaproteobacteria bacterium]|nr:50S ribosomal protein L21 [Alphaproteobacteria bacterium]MDA7983524.1 50S ribosomal protein L21 [Alphaproteobacteria bacterium]MDA7984778.1 50S ribosomal protein L21 [Alphaproteobacteria bacterium]MDA7989200.1 50S ribosomal protein L21 [Alphaproteobacteria bacterium]MDA8000034.1 50S ribosomal protein L21 [Alphaproteobacteria bacterium]